MSDGLEGILALVVTVIVLGVLDIYAFWPVLVSTTGGWAGPMMAVILLVEGAGIAGELKAMG